jgi:hypothetical protein
MNAFDIADQEDVSPWDALSTAVKRRARRVRWVDAVIQVMLEKHAARCDPQSIEYEAEYAHAHDAAVPPADVRTWLAESRNEERLLIRAGKMAVDAGVADALVRRWELEGRLMTDALIVGLDAANLSPDQRLAALSAMHAHLTVSGTDEGVSGRHPSQGTIIDLPSIEDRKETDDGDTAEGD